MRIRKRRPAAEGSCCQNDAAAGASNGGDSGDYINPPNFSSATHDMIPPSCSLLSQRQPHALLAVSSVTGAGPAATPSTAVEDSTFAMWGRSSEPRVSTVLMSKEEEMEQKAMITITENVHRKYGGKPSKLTSAKISVVRADDGMKPGCKKAKELNAVRRKKDLLSSNMVVELKPDSQKVLPLDLILNSKPPSNNVWKSSCSNRQVQVARQGLVISNDTGKPAQEEDHNTPSETQAPTTRTTTKLHPQIGILERRCKSGKGRTTIIRRDTSWLLSSLKGHRRARSYVMPRKSRSNIWGSARRNYDAWAEVGGLVVGHNSAGAKLAMEFKETAPAFLSAEPAKEKDVEHEMDQSRRPIEKKKSAKVMKKKEVPRVNDSVAVASIMINAGKLKKTKTLKTETLKTMKKKTKRSSEVEEQVVDLERCKRRDGRGWQCRKPVMRPGATYCEYHMLKMTESHARNTEQLTSLKMQGEPNNRKRRRKSIAAGEELRGVEGDGDAKTAGGEQAALLRRRRWRKKCKPCIRRLHEIEERAKPVEEATASVSACASTSSLERHAKHHHPHLPECLLNTDPREWRSDLLSR